MNQEESAKFRGSIDTRLTQRSCSRGNRRGIFLLLLELKPAISGKPIQTMHKQWEMARYDFVEGNREWGG